MARFDRHGRAGWWWLGLVAAGFVAPPVWAADRLWDSSYGKPLYEKHCASCHGPQGRGNGPAGRDLVPLPADLTSPRRQAKLNAVLANMIEHGRPGTAMTAWKGRLTEEEIRHLVTYIRVLGEPK